VTEAVNSLTGDFRYAARTLAKAPAFTALILLILGLGIGANVAIFSAVDAVLFRPLPVADPSALVRVYETNESRELFPSSYPAYAEVRDQARSLAGVAAFTAEPLHFARGGEKAQRLTAGIVTGNYFQVLGVSPQRGRLLTPDDDRVAGGHAVAVLSDRLWRRTFAADPRAVGSSVRINGIAFTVVGVAPRRFGGIDLDQSPEIWVTTSMVDQALPQLASSHPLKGRNLGWLDVVGRLQPGTSAAAARAELDTVVERRNATLSKDRRRQAVVLPAGEAALGEDARATARRISWLLLAAVAAVLSIACADAAGLLLVRAERRRREMGIRLALGATRGRLARQLLVESALLAGGGTAVGLLAAGWMADLISSAAPEGFAVPLSVASGVLDARVLAFAAAAGLLTGLLFGLAPALSAGCRDILSSLKGAVQPMGRRFGSRDLLAASQLALAAALLVAAAMLARTLTSVTAVKPGFEASGRVVASVDLALQRYSREQGKAFYDRLLARLQSTEGLRAVALARSVPVQRSGMVVTVDIDGQRTATGEHPMVDLDIASPGFFAALGAPLVAGRDFSAADTASAPAVVIVNEAMARKFWPGQNPVGRRVKDIGPEGVGAEVIGVAADMRTRNLREPAAPTVYTPLSQFYMPRMSVVGWASGSTAAASRAIEEAAAALDANLPLFRARTLEEQVAGTLGDERLLAELSGGFAGLALLIAAAGLYGVLSSAAQARTKEFGIRVALGAQPADIRRIVFGHGARLALYGLAAGLAVAALSGRFLSHLLFGVAPLDPLSFGAAAAVLATAAWAAGAGPARQAVRANPVESLQSE
jgi:putative ABC transport system permease protein